METPKDINIWKITFFCLLVIALTLSFVLYNQNKEAEIKEVEIGSFKIEQSVLNDFESHLNLEKSSFIICNMKEDSCAGIYRI